jgi:hypothetical protein
VLALLMVALVGIALADSRNVAPHAVVRVALALLGVPAFMAGPWGTSLASSAPFWAPKQACPAFLATRPITSGSIASAKLRASWRSVVVTYVILVVGLLVSLGIGGRRDVLWQMADALRAFAPGPRALGAIALAAMIATLSTWRQFTSGLAAGLTGSKALVSVSSLGILGFILTAAVGGARLATHPEEIRLVMAAVPWLIAIMAAIKVSVSAWAFRASVRRGLMTTFEVVRASSLWLIASGSLVGLWAWVVPAKGMPVAAPVIWIALATMVPLGRVALAPLAMDWGRHR